MFGETSVGDEIGLRLNSERQEGANPVKQLLDIFLRSSGGLIAFFTFIAVGLIAGFSILGMVHYSLWWTFGLLLIIPVLVIYFYSVKQRRNLNSIAKIRNDWGKEQITKERNIELIRALFDSGSAGEKNRTRIDDQTWKDLNMDQLYARIDRTLTDPGEAVLYKMLREPLLQKDELAGRRLTIRFFQENPEWREKIQLILLNLGHQSNSHDLFNLLWKSQYRGTKKRPWFSVMALLALISLFIPVVFWSGILVVIPLIMFIANVVIHYSVKRRKDRETLSFPYLIVSLKTARALAAINHPALAGCTGKLKNDDATAKNIIKKARTLFPSSQNPPDPMGAMIALFTEYLNIFFLQEVRSFYATIDEIAKDITVLREIYLTIGEIDAWQSIASYRASLSSYSEPEFTEAGIHLEVREARQPLLAQAVPATIVFDKKVVVITGSNMGGKSTFLRNIGNNVLLAQTIATTHTAFYKGACFRIITSISSTDDLMAGKSFYFVEAERILQTLRSFSPAIPTLCLIDELLAGTNSTERLQASESIIRYLAGQNAFVIIATHDLELAERLNGTCDFYHFSDNVDATGLNFDYQLKPGIATTQNAIALLRYLGYPREITEKTGPA
jgi:hypothetical protein